jgi:hypothetical protein
MSNNTAVTTITRPVYPVCPLPSRIKGRGGVKLEEGDRIKGGLREYNMTSSFNGELRIYTYVHMCMYLSMFIYLSMHVCKHIYNDVLHKTHVCLNMHIDLCII